MNRLIHKLAAALLLIMTIAAAPVMAYNLQVNFMAQHPMVFSVGRLIPGDLSVVDRLEFNDLEPFFSFVITGTGSDALRLFIRFADGAGNPIFTVYSGREPIDMRPIVGRTLTSAELGALDIRMYTTSGRTRDLVDAVLRYLDGSTLRSGFYTVTVLLSSAETWEEAMGNNEGIASLGFMVRNTSQVTLMQPADGVSMSSNPIFLWAYPRSPGVTFELEVVSGDANADPITVIESATDFTRYLLTEIPAGAGGEFTAYTYTGSGGERPLVEGMTYFWRITAIVETIFPGEYERYYSPVYKFTYISAGSGDRVGDILGGGEPEGGAPIADSPIFELLRQLLYTEQYEELVSAFETLGGWNLLRINLQGRDVDPAELARFILTGNLRIVSISVSQ